MIILHGLFGSLRNWLSISQRLGARFRVFSVDLRNHGRSPHAPEMSYDLMAEDLLQFCREHSLESAHILGHSLGGKAAMQFALLYPEYVRKLLVVDIAPRAYESAHEEIFAALQALNLKAYRTRREIEESLAASIPELRVRRFLLQNLARDSRGEFTWKLNLRALHCSYSRLSGSVEGARPFEKPALFVRGAESHHVREDDAAAICRLFPRAVISTVSGAGHWVHADAPEALIEIVENFLGA